MSRAQYRDEGENCWDLSHDHHVPVSFYWASWEISLSSLMPSDRPIRQQKRIHVMDAAVATTVGVNRPEDGPRDVVWQWSRRCVRSGIAPSGLDKCQTRP